MSEQEFNRRYSEILDEVFEAEKDDGHEVAMRVHNRLYAELLDDAGR
jgi:hypothetical protein